MDPTTATVHVVDDEVSICRSIRYLLESVGLCVETYTDGAEFLGRFDANKPGCVVLDVRMPGMSGLEVQERLIRQKSRIPVVVITAHGDVPMAVQAMKSGAVDLLEKPFSDQLLLDAVQASIRKDLEQRTEQDYRSSLLARFERMTPREREVVGHVVAGESTSEIAAKLGVSPKTIEVHRANIMAKSKADSVAELVRWALLAGIAN